MYVHTIAREFRSNYVSNALTITAIIFFQKMPCFSGMVLLIKYEIFFGWTFMPDVVREAT